MRKVAVVTNHTLYSYQDLITLAETKQDKHKAKVKAENFLRDWAVGSDIDWAGGLLELWTEALEQVGFIGAEISWQGFDSQGDGASFTSSIDVYLVAQFLSDTKTEPSNVIATDYKTGKENLIPWLRHKIDRGPVGPEDSDRKFKFIRHIPDDYLYEASVDRGIGNHNYVHENTCRAVVAWDLPNEVQYVNDNWETLIYHTRISALVDEFETAVECLRLEICKGIYESLYNEYDWLLEEPQLLELAISQDLEWDEFGNRQTICENELKSSIPLQITSKRQKEIIALQRRRAISKRKRDRNEPQ